MKHRELRAVKAAFHSSRTNAEARALLLASARLKQPRLNRRGLFLLDPQQKKRPTMDLAGQGTVGHWVRATRIEDTAEPRLSQRFLS
jgi:hypothetical protein